MIYYPHKIMFVHSVKAPRLYKVAAKALKSIKEDGQGLKPAIYNIKHPNVKGIHALLSQTLQRYDELDELFKATQLLEKERICPWLARVLATELIWGKRRLGGDSRPEQTIRAYFTDYSPLTNPSQEAVIAPVKPRFVRVNTLKMSLPEVINAFEEDGWYYIRPSNPNDYQEFLSTISSLQEDQFMSDIHVENLLIFPSKNALNRGNAYYNGIIVLQDKASCFPAHLLNPPPGSVVLDLCAAPGMKTTQLAAILNNQGKVYAVDQSQTRFEVLKSQVEKYEATCVEPILADALTIGKDRCSDAEYILVDPSCSASGTANFNSKDFPEERITKLANFQSTVLKHALSHFPKAKRIVYSTCSVNDTENECVVMDALAQTNDFKLICASQLLKVPWINRSVQKNWKGITDNCIYASTGNDLTDGFFVAVFERISNHDAGHHVKKLKRSKADDDDQVSCGKVEPKEEGGKRKKSKKKETI